MSSDCPKCSGLMIQFIKGRLQYHRYFNVPEEVYYCPLCKQFYYKSYELKEIEI